MANRRVSYGNGQNAWTKEPTTVVSGPAGGVPTSTYHDQTLTNSKLTHNSSKKKNETSIDSNGQTQNYYGEN